MMRRRRKQPPAKKRYDEKYPVVSVRITKELKELLDKYRGSKSYAEVIKEGLENMGKLYEYYNQGYEKARQEYEIWAYCNVCNRAYPITPNSELHQIILDYLSKNATLICQNCKKRYEGNPLIFSLLK